MFVIKKIPDKSKGLSQNKTTYQKESHSERRKRLMTAHS